MKAALAVAILLYEATAHAQPRPDSDPGTGVETPKAPPVPPVQKPPPIGPAEPVPPADPALPVATPPASPIVTGAIVHSKWLIPSLQLSASTDDKGKFKAAIGRVIGTLDYNVYSLWPRIEATSSQGISRLFASDDRASLPVRYGAVFTIEQGEEWNSNISLENNAKIRGYNDCVAACTPTKCDFDKNFTRRQKEDFSIEKLCPRGLEAYLEYERGLNIRESLPVKRLSIGAVVGRDTFKFLTGDPGPSAVRANTSAKLWSWKVGAAGAYTLPTGSSNRAYIFEARGTYSDERTATDQTLHSCVPEGMIDGVTGTLELCKDIPLGPPKAKRALVLAADIGVGDSFRQTWRAAAGVFAEFTHDVDTFGLEFPIYLNFASARAPTGLKSS